MVTPKTKKLIQQDKKFIWHPFTQQLDWERDTPLIIESGKGVFLFDTNRKKYLDGVSSLWVNTFGHQQKKIDAAIKNQLKKMAHSTFLGLTHPPAIELAAKLGQLAGPPLRRVFYSDNGSTAVEIALKMAYQYWQQGANDYHRKKFFALRNAYHGDTLGATSVGGIDLFHQRFRALLLSNIFLPSPYCYRCPKNKTNIPTLLLNDIKNFSDYQKARGCAGECLKRSHEIIKKYHRQIVALIAEGGIQAAAGMITMPPQYLKILLEIARGYNLPVIIDEVATGFGRCGKILAIHRLKIKPDFLALAKGITGGYLPLAATLTTEKIYRAFLGKYAEFKTFFHGHTYTANPLAAAAAIANISLLEKSLGQISRKEKLLAELLLPLLNLKHVGDIRHFGLMVGIEIVRDKKSKNEYGPEKKIGQKICKQIHKYGIILRPLGNVIVLMPPLSISEEELTELVARTRQAIIDITR